MQQRANHEKTLWSFSHSRRPPRVLSIASVMLISVIIPHLNQEDYLATGLAALHAQDPVASDVEIIVVDNGSKRLPFEVCARWPNVRLISESTPGPAPHATGASASPTAISSPSSMQIAELTKAGLRPSSALFLTLIRRSSAGMCNVHIWIRRGSGSTSLMRRSTRTAMTSISRRDSQARQSGDAAGCACKGRQVCGIEVAEDRDWG